MSLARTETPLAKTGFILANGLRIRTAAWPSDGYPAVFVHGLSSGWQSWLPPLAYLWPTLSVTAVDLRGHGDSDKPETGYTLTNYVADVWEAIGKMRLKRPPVLIGHSLGGAIVRRIAADHANALAAVIVEDSDLWGLEGGAPEQRRAFGQQWLENVRRPLPELIQTEMNRNPQLSYREAMERATRVTNTADGVFLDAAEGVALAAGETYDDLLPRIICPFLLVRGLPELGGAVPEAAAARHKELIPDATVVTVPNVGHSVHGQQPEAFSAAALTFLRAHGIIGDESK
ncbi:MAG: alpha/beta hydrolase [Chloroflexota bacterium]|nr:alpha/beta hydrolase [Chloroflexota bacterium]